MFLSVQNIHNLIKNTIWFWPFPAQTPLPRSHLRDFILPSLLPFLSAVLEPFGDGESPFLCQHCTHMSCYGRTCHSRLESGWGCDGLETQPRMLEVQHGGSSPHLAGLISTVGHMMCLLSQCAPGTSPTCGLVRVFLDSSQLPVFPRRMQLCSKQALLCFQSAVI